MCFGELSPLAHRPALWRPMGLSHVAAVGAPTWPPSVPGRAAGTAGAEPHVQMPEKTISWLGWAGHAGSGVCEANPDKLGTNQPFYYQGSWGEDPCELQSWKSVMVAVY